MTVGRPDQGQPHRSSQLDGRSIEVDAGRVEVAELDGVEQLDFLPELFAQAVGRREEGMRRDHQPFGRPVALEAGEGGDLVDVDVGVVDEHVPALDGDLDTRNQDDAVVASERGELGGEGLGVVVADAEGLVALSGGAGDHFAGVVRDEGLRLPRVDMEVGPEPDVHVRLFSEQGGYQVPGHAQVSVIPEVESADCASPST